MKNKVKQYIMTRLPARFLKYKEKSTDTIYLTFDDGPHVSVTPRVLDILNEYNAKASFFIIGEKAASLPNIIKQTHKLGHVIANHSYNHKKFSALSLNHQLAEVELTNSTIKDISNEDCTVFRPPGGIWSLRLLLAIIKRKMVLVNWSRDSLDCRNKTAQEIIQLFKTQPVKGGDIILFHDDDDKVCEILQEILPYWRKQGFSFNRL